MYVQEDEIATTLLSGGVSPYMALVLPSQEAAEFRRLYTFEGAAPEDFRRWQRSFLWMLKKVWNVIL